jgi:hypothetical protein
MSKSNNIDSKIHLGAIIEIISGFSEETLSALRRDVDESYRPHHEARYGDTDRKQAQKDDIKLKQRELDILRQSSAMARTMFEYGTRRYRYLLSASGLTPHEQNEFALLKELIGDNEVSF